MASRARLLAVLVSIAAAASCLNNEMFRQYEYEEELYLSLDGSGTLHVNASVASLVALRGADLDAKAARLDTARIRAMYSSPATIVKRVTSFRRAGRLFAHVRIDVPDVRAIASAAPFAWSRYEFNRRGGVFVFEQNVGASANRDVGDVGWSGGEFVGFRVHLPSKIPFHNAETANLRRGNILVWEQTLADRLAGKPLQMVTHMETESILYRTLWLFALCFVAVVLTFAAVIWWVMRKGQEPLPSET